MKSISIEADGLWDVCVEVVNSHVEITYAMENIPIRLTAAELDELISALELARIEMTAPDAPDEPNS